MQWPKAKNLIIILLAAVNVFLLSRLIILGTNEKYISESFAADSAAVLENKGLYISSDDIPLEIPSAPAVMYSLEIDGYNSFVSHVLLQPIASLKNDILIEDSNVVGAYYMSDAGLVSLYFDGSFSFTANETNTEKAPSVSRARALALNFAQLTGLPASSLSVIHTESTDTGYIFSVEQLVNGLTVEGYGMEIKITGQSVEFAQGRLLLTDTGEVSGTSLPSAVNALFSVAAAFDEEMTVTGMELCYFPANEEDHSYTVCTPSYRIETDKGVLFYLLTSGQIYWE